MEVCRLCLDLITTGGEARPLDGEARDMVQVVVPELNLDVTQNPCTCTECWGSLARLFEFKSRVFEREGEARKKVGDRKGQLGLTTSLTGEEDPGGGTADSVPPVNGKAKDRLCRTCLAPIECESFTVLRPSEPDAYLSSMLDMCLVEVDLELTKDPVMCETCLDHLQKLHHFKSTCHDVEDKIVDYCEQKGVSEGQSVDLHSVLGADLPGDVEMATVKRDPDGAGSSKVKSEEEEEETSDDEDEEEEMSEGEGGDGLKQEELDIKSDAGTSDSDKKAEVISKRPVLVKLWRDLGVNCLPNYLCDLLLWHDVDSYHALAKINDSDLAKMEEFAKNKLPGYLNEDEKKDFYEFYYNHIPLFQIRLGHKKLLRYVVDKSRSYLENLGKKKKRRSDSSQNGGKRRKNSFNFHDNSKAEKQKVIAHLRI